MSMIKCPECRQKISENAVSCPKCGHQITDEDREKAKEQEEKSRKSAKKAGIWFSCSVGIIFVIVVALIIFSPKPESPQLSEEVLNEIEKIISRDYEQYEINIEDGRVDISVQQEGLAKISLLAKMQGSGFFYDQWQDAKMLAKRKAITVQGFLKNSINEDIPVEVRVINDENPENIILAYYGETLIFDIVEE